MWSPRSGCGGLGSRLLSLRKRAEVRVTQFENGGLRSRFPGLGDLDSWVWGRRVKFCTHMFKAGCGLGLVFRSRAVGTVLASGLRYSQALKEGPSPGPVTPASFE